MGLPLAGPPFEDGLQHRLDYVINCPYVGLDAQDIDILYVLGHGSPWQDNELRYSLRSLERHGIGIGRLFIAGDYIPQFLWKGRVIHLQYHDDPKALAWKNIYHKLHRAVRETDIGRGSGQFLMMMDDVFLTRNTDLSRFPTMIRHDGPMTFSYTNPGVWWKSRANTARVLRETYGLRGPLRDFEVHSPVRFDRDKYARLDLTRFDRDDIFVQHRSVYGNIFNIDAEIANDRKITQRTMKNAASVPLFIGNESYFSISDETLKLGMKDYLSARYTCKSRWEKTPEGMPRCAAVAVAKNEGPYIEEWIEHCLNIGFDKIYVYLNDWDWTPPEKYRGMVETKPWNRQYDPRRGGHLLQADVYNDFIDHHYRDCDFAAFIDIDEFICLRQDESIGSLCRRYGGYDAIALHWRMFGDSGIRKFDGEYSVIKRFTQCAPRLSSCIKTIVNIGRTQRSFRFQSAHTGNACGRLPRTMSGTPVDHNLCKEQGQITDLSRAYICHFRVKTPEELAKKIDRNHHGLFQVSTQLRLDNADKYNRNELTDETLKRRKYGKE